MSQATLKLPALRSLGELADMSPTIIIDSREQEPLVFQRLPSKTGTLQTGDYSVAGLEQLFTVERKSVPDLVGCCIRENRERFERELHRLRGFRFKRLLIVGSELEVQQGVAFSAASIPNPFSAASTRGKFAMTYLLSGVIRPKPQRARLNAGRFISAVRWWSRPTGCGVARQTNIGKQALSKTPNENHCS
jgi:hypothetical protein